METSGEWIKAAKCGELGDGDALTVTRSNGRTIALFFFEGEYFASDNQCPHMGFPLTRGTIKNGVLTCDWHGRSFDLVSGGCFHTQCDNLQTYQVEIRDEDVWVFATEEDDDRTDARLRLLWEGLLDDDRWTMSKALALLLDSGVPEADIVNLVLRHIGRHIASSMGPEGGESVSRLINGVTVGRRYEGEDRLIALVTAARSAAGPAEERSAIVEMPPPYSWDNIEKWVREFARDRMGFRIERCLYTAHRQGDGEKIIPMLFGCAIEPHFLGYTDNLISLAYLAELKELFGWDDAGELIFYLGAILVGRNRSEPERFRRDAVNHLRNRLPHIESISERADPIELEERELVAAVTSVNIENSFDAVERQLTNGVNLDRLITTFVLLAADRMARTPVAVDAGWEVLTSELNAASALRSAKRLCGTDVATKGLFHVAWQVFADRWINMEPRNLDEALPSCDPPGTDEESSLSAVLATIETLNVDAVSDAVLGYLQANYSASRLLNEIGRSILRDDTGQLVLPTLRTVFEEWDNCSSGDLNLGADHPARFQLIVGLARFATDVRSNTDSTSAAFTAMRFAEGKTTVEMFN